MNQVKLLKNRHIIEPLTSAALRGQLASAYLFEGPAGSGKRTLAAYLTALFVCPNKSESGPCFACRDCENVCLSSHPDVVKLSPEKDRETVTVEAVRRANEAAQTAPIHAEKRVFVIPDAARLNAAAQNALLKNLEEPRGDVVYLLLCEEAAGVLATIRSRAIVYRMELFEEEELVAELARRYPAKDEATLRLAAKLSGGALGAAEANLSDRRMADCRERALRYLTLLCRGASFAELSEVLPVEMKKEQLPLFYRILLSGVRDLLCANYTEDLRFFDREALPLCQVSTARLMAVCERLMELCDPSMANANVAASVYSLNAVASLA